MRGALIRAHGSPPPLGIIPADAGSTRGITIRAANAKDHPRGCGEHAALDTDVSLARGSSPRMRGAHKADTNRRMIDRIIPADAGSTRRPKPETTAQKDHPRGCGEHSIPTFSGSNILGSSPRMRGAPISTPKA